MAVISWKSAVTGSWTDASRWSTGTVPTSADDVKIAFAGTYTVSLIATIQSAKSITISDPDATFAVDATGGGGTTLSIGGAIANGADLIIGNSTISSATKVTGASLNNTGTIGLTGGSAAAVLSISGPISNFGGLALSGKATLSGGAFLNSGELSINDGPGDAGGGIVSLGALTNSGDLDIGNSALTKAATVTASSLSNSLSGTVHLTGGSAQAALKVNSAAPTTLSGSFFLEGNSLLQFASGGITTIAANSELSLDGSQARVALAAQPGFNSALKTLTKNIGTFDLENGAKVSTTGNLANSGTLGVDSGSRLTLGGTLTNTGNFSVGHSALSQPTLVTAAGVVNLVTGALSVNGLSARATLNILGAAPTTLTGSWNIGGNALVQFGSGGITKIGSSSSLFLDGARAHLQLAGNPANNSALTKLATNLGNLNVINGAAIGTTGGFTNSGFVGVDNFVGSGGSSVTVAGTLTNKGSISIGNNRILADDNFSAAALVNTGSVNLTGSPDAQAKMAIAGAAPSTLAGAFNLTGNAVLQFGSGAITEIGSGSSLRLRGDDARVALSAAPGSNSALTKLGTNIGGFGLADGSGVVTTVDFFNKGSLAVDSGSFGVPDTGGSNFTMGGILTNSGGVSIGNNNIAAATTVKAAALNNTGSLSLTGGTANATLSITGNASNTSFSFNIDNSFFSVGGGGGIFTIGGTLTNSGTMTIGNLGLTKATSASAAALVNTGTINLAGGAAQASFNVGSAAPSTLIGDFNLDGNALLKFDSGGVTTIAQDASLSLDGAKSRVAIGAATATNSALTQLASNFGKFDLANGAKVSTTVGFTNSSSAGVDSFGFGGSSLTVGGILINSSTLQIGNNTLTGATAVKATALDNTGFLTLTGGVASATLAITGNANNSGFGFSIDSFFGNSGGGILTVGGTLTNSGFMTIGNTGLTKATSATAAALTNTGTLDIRGGSAKASLTIAGAAPSNTLTGDFNLAGNASLLFGSGAITAIGSGGGLSLDGAAARIALSAAPGSNSALTKLATNDGSFNLRNGATVNTTVGFTNSGSAGVDSFGVGGSSFKLSNTTLTNNSFLNIGNSGITAASQVTAKNLVNTGSIDLTGGVAQASLIIGDVAPSTLTGDFDLNGNALLQFNGGAITAIDDFASLTLDGAQSRVALAAAPGSNSALTKLATNDGGFTLADGAKVNTTVGFLNNGSVGIDSFGTGGSSLTVGGILNNSSFVSIGNTNLTAATKVNAAALINTSTLNLFGVASATLNITGDANNSGFGFNIDNSFFGGGGIFTVGGMLTNSGTMTIGNTGLTKATSATAAALANTGTISLAGGTAKASLTIAGAAPSTTLSGDFNVTGNASLLFGSGAITAIGSGGGLRLDGALARIALSAASGSNSALTKLGSNAGSFTLANAAKLSTTGGFTNTNTVSIDGGFANAGGSSFTVGGTLNNRGFQFTVGNSAITAATTVTAAALVNSGTITLTGGAAQAKMAIAGAAPSALAGDFNLSGNALLTFGSGAITSIGFGGGLSLDGGAARVARAAAPGSNSALTKLATNNGNFSLANGAVLTTTVGFNNSNSLAVDSGFNDFGGSTFTVGGTLTNSFGFVSIGNSNLTTATTVKAVALNNTGSLSLTGGTANAKLNITNDLNNSGFGFGIDSFGGFGGSGGGNLTIGGMLINSGFMTIGNTGLTRATTANAAALANTGALDIVGGVADDGGTAQASLKIASAAPSSTSTGDFNLTGNALLQFTSGAITAIDSGGGLSLDGAGAFITVAPIPGSNSALTALASNAGSFILANGAKVSTSVGFFNGSFAGIDSGFSNAGGSRFTVVGATLTNSGTFNVGNSFITVASQVTAKNLANTGTINITGGAAPASVLIGSAAPAILTGQVNLAGDALLRYASGAITAIGSGAGLSLDGTQSRVALSATPGSNSALTTLASNAGTLDLENGASLATTVAFSNTSTLQVDTGFFAGGSSLTLGGKLTNSGFVQIGNSGLTGATKVTTTALANNAGGLIQVSGNAAGDKATLSLTGASSDAGTIDINGGGVLALGNTLTVGGTLEFTGGTISGGTLAGAGTISDSFGTGTLDGVTIGATATVDVSFGTLVIDGVTVNGAISGDGFSTLTFAQSGADVMTNISGFSTINLADGGANSLTLTNANFTNVGGNIITVNGGDGNDTINAAGLSALHAIVFNAGTGTNTATGGAGDDVFFAGGSTKMTGGGGANEFTFADVGANGITDFGASAGNAFVVRDSGFNLGVNEGSGTGTLQHLAASAFVANGTGSFTTTGQRFAYNTLTGNLRYDADGSGAGSTASSVAILTGNPTLAAGAAGQMFFTS